MSNIHIRFRVCEDKYNQPQLKDLQIIGSAPPWPPCSLVWSKIYLMPIQNTFKTTKFSKGSQSNENSGNKGTFTLGRFLLHFRITTANACQIATEKRWPNFQDDISKFKTSNRKGMTCVTFCDRNLRDRPFTMDEEKQYTQTLCVKTFVFCIFFSVFFCSLQVCDLASGFSQVNCKYILRTVGLRVLTRSIICLLVGH